MWDEVGWEDWMCCAFLTTMLHGQRIRDACTIHPRCTHSAQHCGGETTHTYAEHNDGEVDPTAVFEEREDREDERPVEGEREDRERMKGL